MIYDFINTKTSTGKNNFTKNNRNKFKKNYINRVIKFDFYSVCRSQK